MNIQDEHAFSTGEIKPGEPSDWRSTGSKVKVLTREFERNHPDEEFEALLAEAYAAQQRLNASRDTSAVQASNANTRKLLDALKGNLL